MDWDAHLNERYRERTQEEVNDLLKEDYERFLREESYAVLIDKLSDKSKQQIREDMIQILVDEMNCGRKDPEFARIIDWEDIGLERK